MDYYDNEGGSTLIYTGEPDLNVTVSDPGGRGGYSAAKLNAITNAEVAKVSGQHPVSGQIKKAAPRGQGVRPRQMPPQPMQQPAMEQPPMQPPVQPEYYQQQGVPQQYYQQPPVQQQFYPQQQYYQQPAQIPVQSTPVQASDPNDPIQRYPANPGEPCTEMIMVNGVYHFYVDLPGVKPSDITLKYINMHLVVSGERKLNAMMLMPKGKTRGNKGKRPEFEAQVTVPQSMEKFEHAFYFPKPVDTNSFKTSFENGVLHVEMAILATFNGSGITLSVG